MINNTRFLGIDFEIAPRNELLSQLEHIVYSKPVGTTVVIHANLNTVYTVAKRQSLQVLLNRPGTVVLFEGIALKLAKFMTSFTWWPDINGTDLVPLFLDQCRGRPLRLALVGGEPFIAETAGKAIMQRFPHVMVVTTLNGFDDLSDGQAALKKVLAATPDVLLLGLGTPLQEMTAQTWAKPVSIPLVWTVGGLFDFWAGKRKRAPAWTIACRLEWLWRFIWHPILYWRRIFIQGPWLLVQVFAIWKGSR